MYGLGVRVMHMHGSHKQCRGERPFSAGDCSRSLSLAYSCAEQIHPDLPLPPRNRFLYSSNAP